VYGFQCHDQLCCCKWLIYIALDDKKVSEHVTVRIYQPAGYQSATHPRPAVVFYHGGGWVTGNLDTEDHLCRTICGRADVVVISGFYRKFPSIEFPENIQDCYDGFQWVRRLSTLEIPKFY
jgi:acetyl esterase/lipase